MNILSYIILIIIAVWFVLAIRYMRKHKSACKCCGDCAHCKGCN